MICLEILDYYLEVWGFFLGGFGDLEMDERRKRGFATLHGGFLIGTVLSKIS